MTDKGTQEAGESSPSPTRQRTVRGPTSTIEPYRAAIRVTRWVHAAAREASRS